MNRVVAITGVSGGIGAATATIFHDAGWMVAGMDRRDPPSATPLDDFAKVDLADADVGSAMAGAFSKLPVLDALVCAAGVQGTASIADSEVGDWDEVLNANARGTFLAMHAAHEFLRRARGSVVNIASIHAVATSIGAAPYAASKAAVVALTRAAALEWAPEVRVNAVLPGAVATPMLGQGMERGSPTGGIDGAIATLATRIPLGRVGQPAEIAQAILFLADSERSSFITGQVLVADGGALARLSTE